MANRVYTARKCTQTTELIETSIIDASVYEKCREKCYRSVFKFCKSRYRNKKFYRAVYNKFNEEYFWREYTDSKRSHPAVFLRTPMATLYRYGRARYSKAASYRWSVKQIPLDRTAWKELIKWSVDEVNLHINIVNLISTIYNILQQKSGENKNVREDFYYTDRG